MVENEYYFVQDTQHSGFMVGKFLGDIWERTSEKCKNSRAIYISTLSNAKEFRNEIWCFISPTRSYRAATRLEIDWLNECIKADKFIPFNEIKFNKTIEIW